jgi:Mlc titration factor MtfA (ptsG expression regulator)
MPFSLREWRRERVLRRARIDDALWRASVARYGFISALDVDEQARLRRWTTLFLAEKRFWAAEGLELTEAMKLDVAVQACLLILNLDLAAYQGWEEIVVYPDEFVVGHTWTDEAGVVHEDPHARAGEAWLSGPVVLSWADVARAAEGDGVNVVIHEFAHKLDMANGDANGFPPLHRGMDRSAWARAFSEAYADFRRRVGRRECTAVDPYAAESPAEFFAVVSESFFELPEAVQAAYPAVYEQLRQFYRQDPAARLAAVAA